MKIRTDLAVEAATLLGKHDGIESNTEVKGNITIERVRVLTNEAGKELGKPIGTYVTITVADLSENDKEDYENSCMCLSEEIKRIINMKENATALVVGLGNEGITADSIGPKCVKKLFVTRHIKELLPDEIDDSVRSVATLSPSVMALTGIETGEIVKGVADRIKPELVIVIDALAARDVKRLGRTIQITDTGINPGSGVGNNRKELSQKTLGVPVVAIGVPMVVDALTLKMDCLEKVNQKVQQEIYEILKEDSTSMVVTPTEIDSLSERGAKIIANGINLALQPMGKKDIDRYTF